MALFRRLLLGASRSPWLARQLSERPFFRRAVRRFMPGEDLDAALVAVGELVHDIDCKDGKFGRSEVAGLERMIAGIVRRHASDDARLERGAAALDDLYEAFRGLGA